MAWKFAVHLSGGHYLLSNELTLVQFLVHHDENGSNSILRSDMALANAADGVADAAQLFSCTALGGTANHLLMVDCGIKFPAKTVISALAGEFDLYFS